MHQTVKNRQFQSCENRKLIAQLIIFLQILMTKKTMIVNID